jgi:hypothetical protein
MSKNICRYQVLSSISIWAGIVKDAVMVLCLLTAGLLNSIMIFWEYLPRLLEDAPLAARQTLWFLHVSAPEYNGEDAGSG